MEFWHNSVLTTFSGDAKNWFFAKQRQLCFLFFSSIFTALDSFGCEQLCRKFVFSDIILMEITEEKTHNLMWWTLDLWTQERANLIHLDVEFCKSEPWVKTLSWPTFVGITDMCCLRDRVPLSKRAYILDAGLRSTVSWIMASQAQIQVKR